MSTPGPANAEFKHTPARVRPYRETWRGFFLAREPWRTPAAATSSGRRTIPQAGCQLHEFAGRCDEAERTALRRAVTRRPATTVLLYEDPGSGALREAFLAGDRLDRVLFFTINGALPPRDWLAELFAAPALTAADRTALLIGRPPGRAVETGPIVCACLGVRAMKIEAAIAAGAGSVDAVGEATSAGSLRLLPPRSPPSRRRARRRCSMPPEPGRVLLVGAGPGAADLLTVRALRAIEGAQALLYDALVCDEVIALAPAACLKIQTGKRAGRTSMKQETINRLMLRLPAGA